MTEKDSINIYILIDPITNKIRYVGKTNNIHKRFHKHISGSKRTTKSHKNAWINGLLKKQLKPIMEVIDVVSNDEWEFWEKYWISQIKTWGFDLTNEMDGGEGVNVGNVPWNKGVKGSIKVNVTSFKKGERPSIKTEIKKGEHKSQNTEFQKGQIPWNFNIPCSDETKAKISNANKGKVSPNNKAVLQFNLSMKLLAEYPSIKTASLKTGVNVSVISRIINKKIKNPKKFIWKYKNN